MNVLELQVLELIKKGQESLGKASAILTNLYGSEVVYQCELFLEKSEAKKIAAKTLSEAVRERTLVNYTGDSLYVPLLTMATRLSKAREQNIRLDQFVNRNSQNSEDLSAKEKQFYALARLRKLKISWKVIAEIMDLPSEGAAKVRFFRYGQELKENKHA